MPNTKQEDTYYDVLKIDSKATIAEIVQAYHTAKNAFSRDSVATYSLFSPQEAQSELNKLEEAYLNLSNIDKKRAYDRVLEQRAADGGDLASEPMSRSASRSGASTPVDFPAARSEAMLGASLQAPQRSAPVATHEPAADSTPAPSFVADGPVTGSLLREIREKRSLSIDDVSRITKIPAKFIRAIEDVDLKKLPARVYLQGFVKNMANLYKLEPASAAKSYLDHTDTRTMEALQPKV